MGKAKTQTGACHGCKSVDTYEVWICMCPARHEALLCDFCVGHSGDSDAPCGTAYEMQEHWLDTGER